MRCLDEVDYLPEDRVYCLRCFWWCLFLHNPVGYRITPPVATLNIHPIANAVSEWDANEKFKMWNGIATSERRYDNDVLYSNCDCGHY